MRTAAVVYNEAACQSNGYVYSFLVEGLFWFLERKSRMRFRRPVGLGCVAPLQHLWSSAKVTWTGLDALKGGDETTMNCSATPLPNDVASNENVVLADAASVDKQFGS
jgi:hypothetical protein